MAFRVTQLGRFGDYVRVWNKDPDPDRRAASVAQRPGGPPPEQYTALLGSKGLWDPSDAGWLKWKGEFDKIVAGSTALLRIRCSRPHPRYPAECWHELLPPFDYGNLRWFANLLPTSTVSDNVVTRGNEAFILKDDEGWNFVITKAGEILTSKEHYAAVKHPCLSGGDEVWSAGRLGIDSGMIRVVDLQSGHFVKSAVLRGSPAAKALMDMTKQIFRKYADAFLAPSPLHSSFDCVW